MPENRELNEKIEKIKDFTEKYRILGEGHMVEFFVNSFYDKIVSKRVKAQLDSISSEDILRLKLEPDISSLDLDLDVTSDDMITDLNDFYQETKSISLMSDRFPEAVKNLRDLKLELGSRNPLR